MSCLQNKIVVVGGGIIGCSTAYYLTKLGHKNVTVVEAVEVAHAASGRAGGFLALDWCDGGVTGELARRSYQIHETLQAELGVECGYRKMNTVSLELDTSVGKNKQRPCAAPEWVDGGVKSSEVIGTTKTTAQVHPKLLTKALMAAAERAGARLVQGRVIAGKTVKSDVAGVRTEDGRFIEADVVILCLGPWTNQGLAWFNCDQKVVTGTRAHSITIMLEGESSIDNTALFLACKGDPEVYPRPDNTVYVCGSTAAEHAPLPDNPADVILDQSACDDIKSLAGQVCQELRRAGRFTPSACYLPHSEDGVPILGQVPGVGGLYMAGGHSCWGILQGPATGEAMAELVITGASQHLDLAHFDPARLF